VTARRGSLEDLGVAERTEVHPTWLWRDEEFTHDHPDAPQREGDA
jgi:hypothetical protein